MQVTEIIDRVRHALRRTPTKSSSQNLPVRSARATLESLSERPLVTPPVDIFENDKEIIICADVPGATLKNTEVGWEQGTGLTLHVTAPISSAVGHAVRREFQEEHDWYRVVQMPDYADASRAESQLVNGVLNIRIPKRSSAQRRVVPIKDMER